MSCARFALSGLHAQDTVKRLWGSGGPWCTRAEVSGYEKHCETFTSTHRESSPMCACGWVGSHRNLCCAWSVYFIAISCRGEFVLRIDRCRSWKINSTPFFRPPKPLLTDVSECTPPLPGQGIRQPWHKSLVETGLYPCSRLRRDVKGEPGGRCCHFSRSPRRLGTREGAHTLQLWRDPAEPVFLYPSFDVIGLFLPFHSRATQSWVWVVLKKTKGGKTAWEWMKSLPQFPHEQTHTKTFLFLTFKNYNREIETWTEKSSCNSRRFHGLKKIYDVVEMKIIPKLTIFFIRHCTLCSCVLNFFKKNTWIFM